MIHEKDTNPLDRIYQVALYKSLKYGWPMVSEYHGEADASYHGEYVRISEPLEVKFTAASDDAVIQNAIAALDAAERAALDECNKRIAEIRCQKAQLLAITHQPEKMP